VTLFITTLVSLLLWLPCNIYILVAWFLFYANSLVNPILYTIRMPDFKKALLSLFRRHQRENVAIPLNHY
ncbi:unnamed protein product, partial [Porites lobata]